MTVNFITLSYLGMEKLKLDKNTKKNITISIIAMVLSIIAIILAMI